MFSSRGRLLLALGVLVAAAIAASVTPAAARTYYCFGKAATIVGTPRADVIVGTAGDDVIYARGGADSVTGDPLDEEGFPSSGYGNDLICGGPGADNITGTAGDDRIGGGDGDDSLGGKWEGGSDVLQGNAGNDTVREAHFYLTESGSDQNVFRGGPGDDDLQGGDYAPTTMYGGDGNDSLTAYAVNAVDKLFGEAGVDTIDSRDFDAYSGERPTTFTPDIVNGGSNLTETSDVCTVDSADSYSGCESVTIAP
jgi:Ca2+-binding RTX toxin-like protein